MSQHIVTCAVCGRSFGADSGTYDRTTRQYICKSCSARQFAAAGNGSGMRQSVGAMIAKLAGGAMFIAVGLTLESAAEIAVGVILGLALIAWALTPYFITRRRRTEALAAARTEAARRAALPRICPSCGARTTGSVCEYCGSPLD